MGLSAYPAAHGTTELGTTWQRAPIMGVVYALGPHVAYWVERVLRVYVDKAGGVGIGECERLSRELGDVLDAAAVIEGGYDLEVSSPGLDRQLKKEREYRWAVGKQVRCWLAGGAEVRGRLKEVTPERLVLERDGERTEVGRAAVTKARLEAEVPWPRKA